MSSKKKKKRAKGNDGRISRGAFEPRDEKILKGGTITDFGSGAKRNSVLGRPFCLFLAILIFCSTLALTDIMKTPGDSEHMSILEKSKFSKHSAARLSKKVLSLKKKIRVLRSQLGGQSLSEKEDAVPASRAHKKRKKRKRAQTRSKKETMVDNDVKETLDQATKPDRNEYKERVKQENEAETVYKKQKSKQTAHDWQELETLQQKRRVGSITAEEKQRANRLERDLGYHTTIQASKLETHSRSPADYESNSAGDRVTTMHPTMMASMSVIASDNVGADLPALDYGEPGNPGRDGMKAKGGAHGGHLGGFVGTCYTSVRYKFTLVHVHKNGGSALADNIRRILCTHHKVEKKKMIKVGPNGYKTCARHLWKHGCENLGKPGFFDFTFARNPWDRAVSMWSYTIKRKQLKTKNTLLRKKQAETHCKFEAFVRDPPSCPAFHDENQWSSMFSRGGEPLLNFIGRLEYFARDFDYVIRHINVELYNTYKEIGFEMANDSAHKKYTDYYTGNKNDLREIIRKRYKKDIELLGYTFLKGGNLGHFVPSSYHDGLPAADLNYGDVTKKGN